jgi:penicillin-binding protein 1A
MKGIDPDLKPQRNWRGEAGLRVPFYKRSWFSALVALFLLAIVAAFGAYSIVVAPLRQEAEKFDLAELRKLESASIIFDRNGEEMVRPPLCAEPHAHRHQRSAAALHRCACLSGR